jgi:hypothetical protein
MFKTPTQRERTRTRHNTLSQNVATLLTAPHHSAENRASSSLRGAKEKAWQMLVTHVCIFLRRVGGAPEGMVLIEPAERMPYIWPLKHSRDAMFNGCFFPESVTSSERDKHKFNGSVRAVAGACVSARA